MNVTKTDFIHYLNCPNSLWLLKHKPEDYPHGEFSEYMKKLSSEGYEVEGYFQALLGSQPDAICYSFQATFQSERGLYAKADAIRKNQDGTINLYEVKSSTSVKRTGKHNQIKDATFQKIAAEEAGHLVSKVFIIHLNKDYIRQGDIDPRELLIFADVTSEVAEIEATTRAEIDKALGLLGQGSINESLCSCLSRTKTNHCDSFSYFNPRVPNPSIYNLPKISKSKLEGFVLDGRFGLDEIGLDEVTDKQTLVLRSAQLQQPVIDHATIARFFDKATYPIYFIDYETYSSAIPLVDGARPQAPIPFQYSLHVKRTPDDTELLHHHFLAEEAAMPLTMIEHMQKNIGPTGSLVSWHASFENTQNRSMAKLYPEKANFLHDLIMRTLDLEDVFKDGYVDIAFGGSTSIKKVLPVIAPDLTYKGMDVASGTDAMEAWIRLINMPECEEKAELREAMLEYCKLDTYAMVKIFDTLRLTNLAAP